MNDLPLIQRTALLSECGKYRWSLSRVWRLGDLPKILMFVMLNPSKADAEIDDPTITRCMGFGWDLGFDGIGVANLYGFRATEPKEMWAYQGLRVDIVGPDNDWWMRAQAQSASTIVVAWGADAGEARANDITRMLAPIQTLYCLGKNKGGSPRHPLYLAASTPLEVYREKETG